MWCRLPHEALTAALTHYDERVAEYGHGDNHIVTLRNLCRAAAGHSLKVAADVQRLQHEQQETKAELAELKAAVAAIAVAGQLQAMQMGH